MLRTTGARRSLRPGATRSCSGDDDGATTTAPATTTPAPHDRQRRRRTAVTHRHDRRRRSPPTAPGPCSPGWIRSPCSTPSRAPSSTLVDATGDVVARDRRRAGSLLFRDVPAGTVHDPQRAALTSETFEVAAPDELPPPSFYAEQAAGRRLRLPGRPATARRCRSTSPCPAPPTAGPYPTVVEYSGYAAEQPRRRHVRPDLQRPRLRLRRREHPRHGLLRRLVPLLRGRPDRSTATTSSRRSPPSRGCSATASGWSASPTPASASSSSPRRSRRASPPSPRCRSSTTAYARRLYPGGIFNTGFAVHWTAQRMRGGGARRPGVDGRTHRRRRRRSARTTRSCACRTPTSSSRDRGQPVLTDELAAPIAPRLVRRRHRRPGASSPAPGRTSRPAATSPTMLDRLHRHRPLLRHASSTACTPSRSGPACSPRLVEFLDLYVAERVPSLAAARQVAPVLSSVLTAPTR